MRCVIIANGDVVNYEGMRKYVEDCDYIICADGGARHVLNMNIFPHMIVGDLDSIDEKTRKIFESKDVVFCKFPKKKDYTDTELAIEYAINKGATEILFIGVIGSRMDHTMANIMLLLPLLKEGIHGKIIDEHNEIMLIDKEIELDGEIGDNLSLVPLTEKVEGITLKGFEYPLCDATILMGQTVGISNRFIDRKGSISIKNGNVLLIKAID